MARGAGGSPKMYRFRRPSQEISRVITVPNLCLPISHRISSSTLIITYFTTSTGSEDLRKGYKQDTKMAFVMKAIYTMAWGLNDMQKDLCKNISGLCPAMLPINGSLYRDYLMNVTFSYMNETVTFDSRGDPPGRYDIMNYQRLENGSFDYVLVGTWDNGTLVVHEDRVVFNSPDKMPPISVCSEPCSYNEYKSFVETGDDAQRCCWICIECDADEYLMNETTCQQCSLGYWPYRNKTGCEALPVKHIMWDDEESIAALCLASLGMITTCFTMLVFIKYNHTPVVKASTRELSYIIFVGMMVSYCATLPLLAPPSPISCALSRILPGLSFAMIYAALVTKTNRIARILAGTKKIMMRKPRFMSATAQVVITCILISIEVAIIATMLVLDKPDSKHIYPRNNEVKLVCNTSPRGIMAPMGWDFFLIAMCTIYAIKTRNLPENFNEAKFIGFSMYTTCVIWVAWVPIYFGSDHKIICMSMCTSLSALVILILLFFPKLYIILLRPEKNDRSAFKTTTNVRCHIGSTSKPSISRSSDRSPSAAIEGMYVGSAMLGLAQPQLSLLQRIRTTFGMPFVGPPGLLPKDLHPRGLLKREISVWSDASGSGNITNQAREAMLRRAYGSQLDLAGIDSGLCREERSCQTTDDLLDPLIPRLRRRVARLVREKEVDIEQGREFFTITHGWMSSQAEAARNAMNRNDSQRSIPLNERPTTTIIREDIQEQTQNDCQNDGDDKGGKKKEMYEAECDDKCEEIQTEDEALKESESSVAGTENAVYCESVKESDCHCEEANDSGNKCSTQDCEDNQHRPLENCESVEKNCCEIQAVVSSFLKDKNRDNQIVNFIGYGSAMPCDPAWKKQRSVSCDNGVLYSSRNVLATDNAAAKEALQRSYGWIPNRHSGNIFSANQQNDQTDTYNRKRKVGVSAKVSDIRGILKSGSLSSVDKDIRVSFDSDLPERRKSSEERVLSPVSSEDGVEQASQQVLVKALSSPKVAYVNPVCSRHQELSKTSFRILEETLSVESDVEASDSCELKTIIIRLGNEEAQESRVGAVIKEKSGPSINWRPKLGRNHKLLSYTVENYSYDNPTAIADTSYTVISDSSDSNVSPISKQHMLDSKKRKYASENELVILDLLQNSHSQKLSAPDHCLGSTTSQSTENASYQMPGPSVNTSSSLLLQNVTVTPPENFRNHSASSVSSTHTENSEQQCCLSTSSVKCKSSSKLDNHQSSAFKSYPYNFHLSPEMSNNHGSPNERCSDIPRNASNFVNSAKVSQRSLSKSGPQTPKRSSQDSLAELCYSEVGPYQDSERKNEPKSCGLRRIRMEVDDDTDESTTPLEEFFRTQGVKFDATSTKSKKL
ncbi:Metabotropic glutamate receptor 1 [Halocaridina rubra]|uniref:Metabotropic glutamate receptor 1 n=1 Tax=Halocaridina rubra TaxID=373956 RepID=A0AAN9FUN2_HALRR